MQGKIIGGTSPVSRFFLSGLQSLRAFLFCGLIYSFSGASAYADTLDTSAPSAFLIEVQTGTVLFAKEPGATFAPGSLAKVVTAAVIFQALVDGEMTEEQLCPVSEHAWRTGGAPSGRSTMFAAIKSEISVLDLLKGLLVHNGNDSAIILAECLSGSEEAFAARMSDFAKDLGMQDSLFTNPTGYPAEEGQAASKTSVRDLAILAQTVIARYRDHYDLFALSEFTWNNIFQRNKNPLVGEIRGLDGLGAGQDDADGYSALASVERNGRRVIASVARLPSDKARLAAIKEVVEGAWDYYDVKRLYSAGEEVVQARVFGGTAGDVPLAAVSNIDVLLPKDGAMDYRLRVVYDGPLKAPVKKGDVVGELRVLGRDGIVHRAEVATAGDVPRGNMQQRALGSLWELAFGWF